jgi:hypothetical protein
MRARLLLFAVVLLPLLLTRTTPFLTPNRPPPSQSKPNRNTTGYSGKRFVFEKAAELGVKAVVLDAPDSWAQLLEPEGVISAFVPIDFSDAESVFDRCLEGIKGAAARLGGLDGVATFCEMAVPLVARLAEKLGLPGNSPASVDAARDKVRALWFCRLC